MIGTLWGLGLAAVAFFGIHLVPVVPGLRARLIKTLTRNGYRGLFSLFSIAAIVWLSMGHARAPYVELWALGDWVRLVPLAVLPVAVCLLVMAYATPDEAKRLVRHPMLAAVALWALTHLLANGDTASVILFGSFALYSLLDMPLIDARVRREEPAAWAVRQRTTSMIPFVALIEGRAGKANLQKLLARALLPGALIYLVFLFVHGPIIGLSALP